MPPATGPSVARRHHQTVLPLGLKPGAGLFGRRLAEPGEPRLERAVLAFYDRAPRSLQLDRDDLADSVKADLTGLLALVAADLDRPGTQLGRDGLLFLGLRLRPLVNLLL